MTEQVREYYFLAVRACIILVADIYILINRIGQAEQPSAVDVLLLALFFCIIVLRDFFAKRVRQIAMLAMAVIIIYMIFMYSDALLMLYIIFVYEIMSFLNFGFMSCLIPAAMACIPSSVGDVYSNIVFTVLIGIIYIQHYYVVASYRSQKNDDLAAEQRLKKDILNREALFKEKLNRSLLQAENNMLDEKSRLSQTLHDKLGHNINGSIYQLEAAKVILDKDPENAKERLQAVINQLRSGMDEIRVILRKERPDKYRLAIGQLQQLCEECSQAGIEAVLDVKGDMSDIPDKYLEIVLDNIFEGVTNALKYSKCTKISIMLHIMNKVLRCRVSDNGIGCRDVVDGMGIAGMRRRIRSVNGILDFETEAGFTINMLLPMQQEQA